MEVCVDCVESAVNAANGGASRLELCGALSEGGLTPTPGLLKVIKSLVSIPVFVMLRPRRGGDFVFSAQETEVIKLDASILMCHGADGFVFGALTKNGDIDEDLCRQIIQLVSPLPVTFHRAFDVCKDPLSSLEIIYKLGFKRILTSGQQLNASMGVQLIKDLINASEDRIVIMPGSGITKDNLANILKETGAQEFHASASESVSVQLNTPGMKFGAEDGEVRKVTSLSTVKELVKIYQTVRKY